MADAKLTALDQLSTPASGDYLYIVDDPAGTPLSKYITYSDFTSNITTLGTIGTGVWTGTDIAVADGGTGASTAGDARTNLGLVAGGTGDIWVEKAGDTMTGNLFINNATLAIGGSAPTSITQIKAIRTISSASANYGFYADMTNSSSGQMAGGLFQAAATGTGNVIGIIANAVANGTTDTTKASGIECSVKNLGANDIVDGYGFRVFDATNTGGGRIFDLYGIEIVGATQGLNNNYGLYIGSVSGATNNYAIYTNLGLVRFGDRVTIDQPSTTAAIPVLKLDQADLSEEFIEFATTVGAGNPIDTAAEGAYYGKLRVMVNGVGYKVIKLYEES